MRIKLVTYFNKGFHDKLYEKTRLSMLNAGHEVVDDRYDHIHIVRVTDFYQMTKHMPDTSFSFLLMGISNLIRYPEQSKLMSHIISMPNFKRAIIMSIDPDSCRKAYDEKLRYMIGSDSANKLSFVSEPPYETRQFYRMIDKRDARKALDIPKKDKVVLYFGTYFYSRGADLLVEAAKKLPGIQFYFVGDTSITSLDVPIDELAGDAPNIHIIDEWVDEETARNYFRACDIVALPYRNFYEHDTSGVLNQAMLAERPVLVPMFSPFQDVIYKYNVGDKFCGDLKKHIKYMLDRCRHPTFKIDYYTGFDKYLNAQTSWNVIGYLI